MAGKADAMPRPLRTSRPTCSLLSPRWTWSTTWMLVAMSILGLSVVLSGCGSTVTTLPTTTNTTPPQTSVTVVTTAPPTVTSTSATTVTTAWQPSSGEGAVMVYLTRGESLATTWRPTGDDPADAIMGGLLDGPTPLEKEAGFSSAVPASTSLRSVRISGDTARVDLSADFGDGGGSLSMLLRVAQVVYSLTELEGVTRVEFLIDGSPVDALGGEGVILEGGVTRADFAGLLPPVLIMLPAPFESIEGSVVVRGTAAADIQVVEVTVTNEDGGSPATIAAQLQEVIAGRRGFEARISLPAMPTPPASARATIVFTWSDTHGLSGSVDIPVEIRE